MLAELGGKLRNTLRKLHTSSSTSSTLSTADLNAILNDITRALIESDVNIKIVMTLSKNIKAKIAELMEEKQQHSSSENNNLPRLVQRIVVDELVTILTPHDNNSLYAMKKGKPNVILFIGLQGAGKTTSIAKYANHYQRKGWKTCMVCADTFRAGAFDQLKQNATKLRVPFYGSYTEADPVAIAEEGVGQFVEDGYEVIIVDTSGRHRQESALFEEMQEISAVVRPDNTILVMDATQGQAVYDQAMAFHNAVAVGSVIVTKLDGHAKGGGALSAVAATNSPIVFLGSGEHFDDFDKFNARSFVNKLLGYGDMRGLVEHMKEVNDGKGQTELMEKFQKGEFTLRDMYSQFQNVMKLGPMNKVMGMIPGMPEYLIPKGSDQEGTNRIKKFMYMMDSMNNAELDGKVDMHKKGDPTIEARIKRIARGSGTHPQEVRMLLQCHKQFEGVVSKMGKSGMMKAAQNKNPHMQRNPNQMMQQLNKNLDPKLIQQMGGAGNMMNMMQQMSKMGGMPGMGGMGGGGGGPPNMAALEAMMKQMGGGAMPPGGGMPPGGMDFNAMARMMNQMGMGGMGGMGGGRR